MATRMDREEYFLVEIALKFLKMAHFTNLNYSLLTGILAIMALGMDNTLTHHMCMEEKNIDMVIMHTGGVVMIESTDKYYITLSCLLIHFYT